MNILYKIHSPFLITVMVLFLSFNISQAQGSKISKIVAQGDTLPSGKVLGDFGSFSFNNNEDLVFNNFDSSFHSIIYVNSQGKTTKVISQGDSLQGIGRLDRLFASTVVSMNDQGTIAFLSQIPPQGVVQSVQSGIFLVNSQGIKKVIRDGEAAPSGLLSGLSMRGGHPLNNSGTICFEGFYSNPSRKAVFIDNAGAISEVAVTNNATPIGGVFEFGYLYMMDYNDQGQAIVVSNVRLNDTLVKPAIFLSNGKAMTKVVSGDDTAPDGKNFTSFTSYASINNSGDIVFIGNACKNGQQCYNGVYLYSGGTISLIAKDGDPAPGGGAMSGFLYPEINDSKQIVFNANVDLGGGSSKEGLFSLTNGALQKIVREGDPSPSGGTFSFLQGQSVLTQQGSVGFASRTTGGSSTSGIFLWNGGPRLGLSSDQLDFTDIIPGQVSKLEMDITNTGGKTLQVTAITAAPDPPFGLENLQQLPLSLESGQSAQFLVTYQAPKNIITGLKKTFHLLDDGSLTITSNVRGGPRVVPLSVPNSSPLRVDILPKEEIKSGEYATIEIKVVDKNNNIDKTFNGGATVTLLEDQSTPGITRMQTQQSVLITEGKAEPIFFFTPKDPFAPDKPINDVTVLSGKAVFKVQLENSSIPALTKQIDVKSPLDFYIDRIEVQQGVLNTDKDVFEEYQSGTPRTFPALPFIAEHPTALQVFVSYHKTVPEVTFSTIHLTGISAALNVLFEGNPIKTIDQMKTGASASRIFELKDTYEPTDQENMMDALNAFFKPNDLTNQASYSFNAELTFRDGLDETASEKDNNKKSYQAQFSGTKQLRILALTGVMTGKKPENVPGDAWDNLKEDYPIQNSQLIVNDPNFRIYYFSGGLLGTSFFTDIKFGTLTNILDRYNKENLSDQRDVLLMFAPLDIAQAICSNTFSTGCAASIGARVGILAFSNPDGSVHEIGHMLGLRDTYKTDKYTTDDGEPNPRRSNADNSGNGVENGNINVSANSAKNIIPGVTHHEFMGSVGGWVDRVTWNYLYRTKFQQSAASSGSSSIAKKNVKTDNGFIAVSGTIDTLNTVKFNPFLTLSQVPGLSEPQPNGQYSLEFQDGSGKILSSDTFDIAFIIPDAGKQKEVPFSFYLALPAGTKKAVMRRQGVDIADRNFSTNPPSVRLTFPKGGETISGTLPVQWTSSDPDGDKLTYDVLYNPNGKDQIVLAVGLDTTFFLWTTDSYPSTASGTLTVVANDGINESRTTADNLKIQTPVVVINDKSPLPKEYALYQNYPNPFNPLTNIKFDLPNGSRVLLTIYNVEGKEVKRLVDGYIEAGEHTMFWDSRDDFGHEVASGTYFMRMRAGEYSAVRKVIILK
jgi:hypothetical protein